MTQKEVENYLAKKILPTVKSKGFVLKRGNSLERRIPDGFLRIKPYVDAKIATSFRPNLTFGILVQPIQDYIAAVSSFVGDPKGMRQTPTFNRNVSAFREGKTYPYCDSYEELDAVASDMVVQVTGPGLAWFDNYSGLEQLEALLNREDYQNAGLSMDTYTRAVCGILSAAFLKKPGLAHWVTYYDDLIARTMSKPYLDDYQRFPEALKRDGYA
jgi:hypothetical protein